MKWIQAYRLLLGTSLLGFLCVSTALAQSRARDFDEDQADAATAFLSQERDAWALEGRLLKSAMEAVAVSSAPSGEMAHRKLIRKGRGSSLLNDVRDFIDRYLSTDSQDFLKEVADANGVHPEDVFADYLTVEATIDFSLMASAYNTVNGPNIEKFPTEAKRLLRNLVEPLRAPPTPKNDIAVGRVKNNELAVSVFGCDIVETITDVNIRGRSAKLTWESNYFFLRDLKDRKDPQKVREDSMESASGRSWKTTYLAELEDFVDVGGRNEWGKKVRELADIGSYLKKDDPLDREKSKRNRFLYDPDNQEDGPARFTSQKKYPDTRDRDDDIRRDSRDSRETRDKRDTRDRRDDRDRDRRYD